MNRFRRLLLEFLKSLLHRLERAVHQLQVAGWNPELDERTLEILNGGCYSTDEKEAVMAAVIYGERIDPPQNEAVVRVVTEKDEYRLKAALIRPHGLDYEIRGPIEVVSVKSPEPLKKRGAVVVVSAKPFADSIRKWNEEKVPIQLPAKKAKWAR